MEFQLTTIVLYILNYSIEEKSQRDSLSKMTIIEADDGTIII